MRIRMIGKTVANAEAIHQETSFEAEQGGSGEDLVEFAGRLCYLSFNRPNPGTAANADYIANILKQQHYSVLEHASATFLIQGVSRSLTHELVRHRHLSYSELSQRFVDVENAPIVVPPAASAEVALLDSAIRDARTFYSELTDRLELQGLPRKQVREAARAVMPNMLETKIVVTGNLRAWRDVIALRGTAHADAEICRLAVLLLRHLQDVFPASFSDMHIFGVDGREVVLTSPEEQGPLLVPAQEEEEEERI